MKNIIFFGDSITEGSNSTMRFTDYIKDTSKEPINVVNKGISGTTIGEYSIYPVDGNSLLSIYNKDDRIKNADTIVLEYGSNDISALMCGFIDIDKIMISFVKALDGISQLNPSAKIKFLSLTDNDEVLIRYAMLQCAYLEDKYFANYNFKFPASIWADRYKYFVDAVSKSIEVVPMVLEKEFLTRHIGTDNLHPNETGHKIIASNIQDLL